MAQSLPKDSDWLPDQNLSLPSKPGNQLQDLQDHEQSKYALENSLLMKNLGLYKVFKTCVGRTSQERLFMLKALTTLSGHSSKALLGTMPIKENRPILEITEHRNMSRKLVQSHVRAFALKMLPKIVASCDRNRLLAISAEKRLHGIGNALVNPKLGHLRVKYLQEFDIMKEELRQSQDSMVNSLTTLAAYHCIKHVRVYGNQLTFPKTHQTFDLITTMDLDDKTRAVLSRRSSEKITKLLLGDPESEILPTFPFTLAAQEATKVPFLLVNVTHLPMSGPKLYFTEYFLTRRDKIVYVYPDQRKIAPGKTVTTVLVQLGSTDIPPKQLIQGRHTNNMQYDLINSPEKLEVMKLRRLARIHNSSKDQKSNKALLRIQSALNTAERHIKSQKREIAMLSKVPPLTYIYDLYRMKIQIVFPQGQCTICHTTAHLLQRCEKKVCHLCLDRSHIGLRCPFRCGCKMGETHAVEECSFIGPREIIVAQSLFETRMRNDPRRQDFIH